MVYKRKITRPVKKLDGADTPDIKAPAKKKVGRPKGIPNYKSDEPSLDDYNSDALADLFLSFGERGPIIRSYCLYVKEGGLSYTEWKKRDRRAPSASGWFKPFSRGGKYWGLSKDHDAAFREMVEAYWQELQRAQHKFMIEETRKSTAIIQKSVIDAAHTIRELALNSPNHVVRLNAAKEILKRQAVDFVTPDEKDWDDAEVEEEVHAGDPEIDEIIEEEFVDVDNKDFV